MCYVFDFSNCLNCSVRSLELRGVESKVELAMYDLSHGAANWIPTSMVGGHKLEGTTQLLREVFTKYGGYLSYREKHSKS